jgi:hypothetical protein
MLVDAQGAMLVLERVRIRLENGQWVSTRTRSRTLEDALRRVDMVEAALKEVCKEKLGDTSLKDFDARKRLDEIKKEYAEGCAEDEEEDDDDNDRTWGSSRACKRSSKVRMRNESSEEASDDEVQSKRRKSSHASWKRHVQDPDFFSKAKIGPQKQEHAHHGRSATEGSCTYQDMDLERRLNSRISRSKKLAAANTNHDACDKFLPNNFTRIHVAGLDGTNTSVSVCFDDGKPLVLFRSDRFSVTAIPNSLISSACKIIKVQAYAFLPMHGKTFAVIGKSF